MLIKNTNRAIYISFNLVLTAFLKYLQNLVMCQLAETAGGNSAAIGNFPQVKICRQAQFLKVGGQPADLLINAAALDRAAAGRQAANQQ